MQVRPVEFQEHFARIPVEQARQQHVLQREPDLARDQSARVAAEGHLLDLSRAVQTTETEGAIIHSEDKSTDSQSQRRNRNTKQRDESAEPAQPRSVGQNIDVIA